MTTRPARSRMLLPVVDSRWRFFRCRISIKTANWPSMGNGSAELLRRNNSAIEFEQFPRTDAVRFRFHYTELKVTNLNLSPDSALKRLGFRLAVI